MKKFISLVLAMMMLVSCVCISATAADEAQVLHFDANASGWTDFTKVYCHIWAYGGDSFAPWQSKKSACADTDGDGIWTYDITSKGFEIEEGQLYVCIFSNNAGKQIYDLLFDSTVLGDTAYGVEFEYENPEDSSKSAQAGFWMNQDPAVFGASMVITSIGNVVGTCVPNVTTAQAVFEEFLANTEKLDNVRTYSGKADQAILDDIAIAMGLTVADIETAIVGTGAVVEWDAAVSTAPQGSTDPEPTEPEPTEPEPTEPEPTEPEPATDVLYFDANVSGWTDFTKVYCHIWAYGGDAFFSWQSKKEACTDEDGDGIWTYDLAAKGVELEVGEYYLCIFSNNKGTQIYNLLFDSTVLGDTAYGVDNVYENPEDSSKSAQVGFWKGQDPKVFGPQMCITSIGNVVGTCIYPGTTAFEMFEDFISDFGWVENVRIYSGKTDQQIVDDIANALGLSISEVAGLIFDYESIVGWNAEDSTIGQVKPERGDVDLDGVLSIMDVTAIQMYLAKLTELDGAALYQADANQDGYVTILDGTHIQLILAELE